MEACHTRSACQADIALAAEMSAGMVVPLCHCQTVLVSVFEPYARRAKARATEN